MITAVDFCQQNTPYKKGDYGTKTAWDNLLSSVLGVSVRTVQRWGENYESCPAQYLITLEYANSLRKINRAMGPEAVQKLLSS